MPKQPFQKMKKSEENFEEQMKSKPRPTKNYLRQLSGLKNLKDVHQGERKFYKKHKHVAGMATEGRKTVTLNPYNNFNEGQKEAVYYLEEARHQIDKSKKKPKFKLTDEQEKLFSGYGKQNKSKEDRAKDPGAEQAKRESIISRMVVGDSSSGLPTNDQIKYAKKIERDMQKRKMSYFHPKKEKK